jgi:DNA-binding PadR family transcriptional regulator
MALSNLIEVSENESTAGSSRRTKISYSITEAGKKRFAE